MIFPPSTLSLVCAALSASGVSATYEQVEQALASLLPNKREDLLALGAGERFLVVDDDYQEQIVFFKLEDVQKYLSERLTDRESLSEDDFAVYIVRGDVLQLEAEKTVKIRPYYT